MLLSITMFSTCKLTQEKKIDYKQYQITNSNNNSMKQRKQAKYLNIQVVDKYYMHHIPAVKQINNDIISDF